MFEYCLDELSYLKELKNVTNSSVLRSYSVCTLIILQLMQQKEMTDGFITQVSLAARISVVLKI